MPSGWSGDCVRMLRMTASRSAIFASRGRYSQTCKPVTRLWIGRNSPPVGRPGLRSKVSIWLAPPFIHSRMQRLPRFFASAAIVWELTSPPQLGSATPPVVASAPLRNARRLTCSCLGQSRFMSQSPLELTEPVCGAQGLLLPARRSPAVSPFSLLPRASHFQKRPHTSPTRQRGMTSSLAGASGWCGRSGPAKGVAERLPGAILLRGGDALRDEVHAVHAVGDVRIEAGGAVHFLACGAAGHVVVGGSVDVGEGFEEGLGVTAGNARAGSGGSAEVRPAGAGVQPVRLAVDANQHLVRLLLVPLDRGLRAVDLDPQVVFATM